MKDDIPAFPDVASSGMTLRDYFAGRAMQAIITGGYGTLTYLTCAESAYMQADAMLKERELVQK